MNNTMRVYKIRKNAKLPHRAHPTDAGMDLFYCPDNEELSSHITIDPGSTRLIPTGIKVEVPNNHMLEVKNKSGIAFKQQLVVGACVVDAGYDGELYINLHNIGTRPSTIESGQKVAQGVLIPIVTCEIQEVREDCLNQATERGSGAFGSTGLK
jgi:dUTP pyrophosphatase